VHYVGKTGTFVLLGAFPLLLLAAAVPATEPIVGPIGWGLAWWALGLYWAAAVLYLAQTVAVLRADRAGGGPGPSGGPGSGLPRGPGSGPSGTPAPGGRTAIGSPGQPKFPLIREDGPAGGAPAVAG
jgi:hypothetical protein